MSALPAARESKAICLPSGDQRGEPEGWPLKDVNWTGRCPVLSATQICPLPERFEAKAILLPSGDNRASTSSLVEAINCCGQCLTSETKCRVLRNRFHLQQRAFKHVGEDTAGHKPVGVLRSDDATDAIVFDHVAQSKAIVHHRAKSE